MDLLARQALGPDVPVAQIPEYVFQQVLELETRQVVQQLVRRSGRPPSTVASICPASRRISSHTPLSIVETTEG